MKAAVNVSAVQVLANVTSQATATTRVNLAVQHLLAAASFSREVGLLEKQHTGEQFAGFWEDIFHQAIACVLTTVASLEAYANELFFDREKTFPEYSPELLHNLWTTYEAKSIVEKFEFALLLRKKPPLERGARPFQDVKVLVELRNALTHFKPEWANEANEHKKLSAKLAGKVEGSPFLTADTLLFPRKWASHSCTTWAIKSTIAFAEAFEAAGDFPSKFKVGDPGALEP